MFLILALNLEFNRDPMNVKEDENKQNAEEMGERVINTSESAKREANNRNNESGLRNTSPSFSQELQ